MIRLIKTLTFLTAFCVFLIIGTMTMKHTNTADNTVKAGSGVSEETTAEDKDSIHKNVQDAVAMMNKALSKVTQKAKKLKDDLDEAVRKTREEVREADETKGEEEGEADVEEAAKEEPGKEESKAKGMDYAQKAGSWVEEGSSSEDSSLKTEDTGWETLNEAQSILSSIELLN